MSKNLKVTIIVVAVITCLISIGGSYAATTYATSANKVGYTDNSSLGVTNVQAAIDGTCSNIAAKLSTTTGTVSTSSTYGKHYNYGTPNYCNKVYKYGNIITYTCSFYSTTAVPQAQALFTLPTGYRPTRKIDISITKVGYGNSYNGFIDANGSVAIGNNSIDANVWYSISATFII